MHWNRSFILISIALILSGCYSKEDQNKKVVQEWYGKTVVIPSSLKPKVAGRDTTISASEILDKDYNVLTFVDTTGCTECNLRLYDWRLLIEEVKQYSKEINFIFVIHSSNFDEISAFAVKNKFNYPLFYDYDNSFAKANKNLPAQPEFQSFLLDNEGKVILVGNPVKNKSLWKLYKKQMEIYDKSDS